MTEKNKQTSSSNSQESSRFYKPHFKKSNENLKNPKSTAAESKWLRKKTYPGNGKTGGESKLGIDKKPRTRTARDYNRHEIPRKTSINSFTSIKSPASSRSNQRQKDLPTQCISSAYTTTLKCLYQKNGKAPQKQNLSSLTSKKKNGKKKKKQ